MIVRPVETIVVGYDEGAPAERALGRAVALARAFDSRLVVTSVVPVLVGVGPWGVPGPKLQRVRERLAELDVDAEVVEAVGDPAEAIVQVAERVGADLIVVGTREPSLIERTLGHSVSEAVQRRATCDVLIVH